MKAVITGASSGIGYEIADILSHKGYQIYAIARRGERLEQLKRDLPSQIVPIVADLSDEQECFRVYEFLKSENIDILINNAGCGVYGPFADTNLDSELNMIDLNIKSVHILTKLFLKDFLSRNSGYIMNVSSSAGFMMGPLFSSYYASKSYVLRLTQAITRELREKKSNVKVSVLCPGPVKTEFDKNAGITSSLKGMSGKKVAQYAVNKMLKGKTLIIPGAVMKFSVFFSKLLPQTMLSKITYICQKKKS